MTTDGRTRLRNEWGTETVVKCCRYWKTHGYMRIGRCGICHQYPEPMYGMTWEETEEQDG